VRNAGVIYVEFLIVFFPIFLMFLGIIQLAFIYTGKLIVRHSAFRTARAAVVILDDDPSLHDNAPRGCLAGSSSDGGFSLDSIVQMILQESYSDDQSVQQTLKSAEHYRDGNSRYKAIVSAAGMPLLPLAPDITHLWSKQSLERAIGNAPVRALSGLIYNLGSLAVTFPENPGERAKYKFKYGKRDPVTIRVTYLFHCGVPGISALLCDTVYELMTGVPIARLEERVKQVVKGDFNISDLEKIDKEIRAERKRLAAMKHPMAELTAAESPSLMMLAAGNRFRLMQAEVTLPNQGANYRYPEEPDEEDQEECPEPSNESEE